MGTIEIECQREDCLETFQVGDEETARCPACGQKHTAPFGTRGSAAESSASVATDGGQSGEHGATVEAPAGSTVRITIEILPSK